MDTMMDRYIAEWMDGGWMEGWIEGWTEGWKEYPS